MNLPMPVCSHHEVDILLSKLAEHIQKSAQQSIYERSVFHLALSGGNSPKLLFERMSNRLFRDEIPWESVHVWQVDERVVPPSDKLSNWKMITENLIDKVPIALNHLHPMPVMDPNGTSRYESDLRDFQAVPLDYILLGLGLDGHTASLFPGTPALNENKRWIVLNDGESIAKPRPRMTMTYPILNSARSLSVFVPGLEKRKVLEEICKAGVSVDRYPVLGVRNRNQKWFIQVELDQNNLFEQK